MKYSDMSCINVAVLKNRCLGYGKVDSCQQMLWDDNYLGDVLSVLGHSVKYTENVLEGDIIALLPTTATIIPEEELKLILTKKLVILCADTVKVLIDRGFANLLYINNFEKLYEGTGRYTYEQVCKEGIVDDKYLRASAQIFCGHYMKIDYVRDKAQPLTKIYNYDYSCVGNGITLINNNILVFPYFDSDDCKNSGYPAGVFHELRGQVINYVVSEKNTNATLFCKNVMTLPYFYKKGDKDYVLNYNVAPQTAVVFELIK